MKTTFILLCLFACFNIYSQQPEDSLLVKNYRLNFAIPEHPAFDIVGSNPDNILRPANSNELFSLIYSDFLTQKTPIIPKNISLEFAPAQLIGINKVRFDEYRDNNLKRILCNMKVSVAAKTSGNADSLKNLGIGLRLTWVDKTALVENQDYIKELIDQTTDIVLLRDRYLNDVVIGRMKYNGTIISYESIAKNDEVKAFVDEEFRKHTAAVKGSEFLTIKNRKKYKNEMWNKAKFETAIATRVTSPDSLIKNSHYSKITIYNTFAFPIKTSGQGLIGLNYSNELVDSVKTFMTDSATTNRKIQTSSVSLVNLSSRFYVGTNSFKVFFEGSCKFNLQHSIKPSVNFGSEFLLRDGIWGIINLGNNWTGDTSAKTTTWSSNFYWNFHLRFQIPEKIKI
jgi:hypothetical protein